MKGFSVLLMMVFSCVVNAATPVSPDVGRLCAQLMGDVIYLQVTNSSSSSETISSMLDKVEHKTITGRGNVIAKELASEIRVLLKNQVGGAPYDAGQFKTVVDTYERLVSNAHPESSDDSKFLMLDFRYRYLSKTLRASGVDWSTVSAPLIRSVEESYVDADKTMKKLAAVSPNLPAVRKWSFLRSRVVDYNAVAIPALANSMLLRIANELNDGRVAVR